MDVVDVVISSISQGAWHETHGVIAGPGLHPYAPEPTGSTMIRYPKAGSTICG